MIQNLLIVIPLLVLCALVCGLIEDALEDRKWRRWARYDKQRRAKVDWQQEQAAKDAEIDACMRRAFAKLGIPIEGESEL